MSEWQNQVLENIVEEILDYRGKTPPKADHGIPLITAKIVKKGMILEPNEFISETTYHSWMVRGYPKVNDVVLTMEAPLGEVGLLKDSKVVPGQRIVMLRGKSNVIDNRYLKYYFQSRDGQYALQSRSSGTTVFGIKSALLKKIPIPTPPLYEQKAIAEVLGSLDDKIDLLQRQNKTLEHLAQLLFRHWFVDFQYPEKYKINNGTKIDYIETEIGKIPNGWKLVSFEDITSRITDGAHISPPSVEFGLPMASVKDMNDWEITLETCRRISEDDFDELVRNDCKPQKGDVLIAKDGSYLKHIFTVQDELNVVILSSIAILRTNELYDPILLTCFLKLESTKTGMENIVTGAVIPRIVLKDFRKYKIPLPPKELQNWALIKIRPIYEMCWANNKQVRTLETLRDTLLPKLINGEVRVICDHKKLSIK